MIHTGGHPCISLLIIVLPFKFPNIWDRTRQMGLPENNNKSKAEYTNTQQDLPDKKEKYN
jgi:hypothetical protein